MSDSSTGLWKLIVESRLLSESQCQKLQARYEALPDRAGEERSDAKVAQWLLAEKKVTRYQAAVLLAGRTGPFLYGDYKIYDHLAQGRLAGRFRAVHVPTGHRVLLQFLGEAELGRTTWPQVRTAAERLAGIRHPHVARLYEAVEVDAFKFLVWEDLRGQALEEFLAGTDRGRLSPKEAVRVAWETAQGLAELHRTGVIHADVRPHNIWLQAMGRGTPAVARLLPDLLQLPQAVDLSNENAELRVRADYLAPEFLRPATLPDARTDVYALGCTLYQVVSGQPPFAGGSVAEKMPRHAREAIASLEPLGASPALNEAVAFMMAKNPDVRIQSAEDAAQRLANVMEAQPRRRMPPPHTPAAEQYERHLQRGAPATATSGERSAAANPAPDPQASQAAPLAVADSIQPAALPTAVPSAATTVAEPTAKATLTATAAAPQVQIPSEHGGRLSPAAERLRQSRRAKKNQQLVLGAAAAAVAVLLVGGLLWSLNGNDAAPVEPEVANTSPTSQRDASQGLASDPPASQSARQRVVPDDGETLWAAPTEGEPIELNYVPPGAQVLMIVRAADLLAGSEGPRVLQALGPDFEALRKQWEAAAGVSLNDVEQLVLSLHDSTEGTPRPAFVVHLKQPMDRATLLERWQNPTPVGEEGSQYYQRADSTWNYYLPAGAENRVFVMGAATEMQDVIDFQGAPPPLRREIEQLLQTSDRQQHVTALFAPGYLLTDGRELFSGDRQKILKPFDWLLGDGSKASMLGMHLGDSLYLELRMIGTLDKDARALAADVRNRLRQVPERIESYLARINPHPYWRMVAFRYPQMVRFLHNQTRIGVENEQAVVNAVLPSVAAHNLLFGAEMTLHATPVVAETAVAGNRPTGPQTLEQLLQANMSLSFDQQSLEFAIQDVADQVRDAYPQLSFPFAVKILGDDLRMEGITRNQQVRDFRQEDQPVAQVLTQLVMKANPVTTVQDPSEEDQKLIWTIGPDPENPTTRIVLITTRQAAAAKGLELPAPFQPK